MFVRRVVCISGLLLLFHCVYSQESLKSKYQELTQLYDGEQYEEARVLADTLSKQAISVGDQEIELRANVIRAFCRQRLKMIANQTVPLLEKALENPEFIDPKYEADIYWALGASYPVSGDHYKSHLEDHFKKSDSLLYIGLELFEKRNDRDGVVRVHRSLGLARFYDEDFIGAMNSWQRAYELALEFDYSDMVGLVTNIAILHNTANRWEDALEIGNSLLNDVDKDEIYWKYSNLFLTMGNAQGRLKNWRQAAQNYAQIIRIVNDDKGKLVKMWTYESLARCYLALKEFDSLEYWVNQSEEYFDQINARRTRHYMNLYKGYLELEKGSYEKALSYADLHLKQAQKDNWADKYSENNKLRYEIYREWGKPGEALPFYEKHMAYEDSTSNSNFSKVFDDYKVMLATAEQRADILQLEKDVQSKNLRIWLVSIGLGLSLIAAFFVVKYYRVRRIKAQEELFRKEQQLTDHTVAMLRKNQAMAEIDELVKGIGKKSNGELVRSVQRMERVLSLDRKEEESWNQFLEYFGAIHSDFFTKLKNKYKDLSSNDLKHCALIRMNLSLKQAADIFGVGPGSVKVARYRLKKKMNLDDDSSIFDALATV